MSDLFTLLEKKPDFDGATYDPAYDKDRLTKQIGRTYAAMVGGGWHTLAELERITGDPQASISARLRDLRKERFGSYIIERRNRGLREHGLFEYRLLESAPVCP